MADHDVPDAPPSHDLVIASYRWNEQGDAEIDRTTAVRAGRLVMTGHGASSMHGYTPHERLERDVIIDVVADFSRLADDEGFGVFVRRNAPDRYIGLRITPAGTIAISAFDGDERPLAVGPLADGMELYHGRNRVAVAAVGPSITLALNSLVVTSVLIDERFVEGYVGLLLEQRHEEPSEVAIDWTQLRRVW